MPLPSRRKGEEKSAFVSRCIADLSRKGEGEDAAQRAAICHSRAENSLTDDEIECMEYLTAKIVIEVEEEDEEDEDEEEDC